MGSAGQLIADTTAFVVGGQRWVARGLTGLAVCAVEVTIVGGAAGAAAAGDSAGPAVGCVVLAGHAAGAATGTSVAGLAGLAGLIAG